MLLLNLLTLITRLIIIIIIIVPLFFRLIIKKWSEKNSAFECGIILNNYPRNPFSIRFFLLIILFIIFDIEITLLLALPILIPWNTKITIFIILFIIILLRGLIYEWVEGSLNWKL